MQASTGKDQQRKEAFFASTQLQAVARKFSPSDSEKLEFFTTCNTLDDYMKVFTKETAMHHSEVF